MSPEQMNFMKVYLMRNFSTYKDVMKQINSKQQPMGKEHVSAILSTEPTTHRSMKNLPSSIDIRPKTKLTVSENPNFDNQYLTPDKLGIFRDPDGYARAIDGHALQVSRKDIADILQMANGADNLFMQQRTAPAHQQRVIKEFYDTAGGIDKRFKQKYRHPTRPSIDVDVLHQSTDVRNLAKESLTFLELGNFTGKRRMSMESTETIRDIQDMWMDTSSKCPRMISKS